MTYYAAHDDDTIYAVSAIDAQTAIEYAMEFVGGRTVRIVDEISEELFKDIDANGWDGRRRSFAVLNGELIETTNW